MKYVDYSMTCKVMRLKETSAATSLQPQTSTYVDAIMASEVLIQKHEIHRINHSMAHDVS
eukprot:939637-Lingulodinium_polyedra.AAC.1